MVEIDADWKAGQAVEPLKGTHAAMAPGVVVKAARRTAFALGGCRLLPPLDVCRLVVPFSLGRFSSFRAMVASWLAEGATEFACQDCITVAAKPSLLSWHIIAHIPTRVGRGPKVPAGWPHPLISRSGNDEVTVLLV